MTVSIRERVENAATGTGAISLTLTNSQVGDTVAVWHFDNFHTAAGLTTPTGTAVASWTLRHTLDGGTDDSHAKLWQGTVTTAGGTVIEGTNNTDHERLLSARVYVGTVDFDEAASTDSDVNAVNHDAPAVTSDGTDASIFCAWASVNQIVNYSGGDLGSMTVGSEFDLGTFCTYLTADQAISSAGSTGTRRAVASITCNWAAVSALFKAASAGPTGKTPQVVSQYSSYH